MPVSILLRIKVTMRDCYIDCSKLDEDGIDLYFVVRHASRVIIVNEVLLHCASAE